MRILLCFPMKDGQTGPAIKTGFQRLGHDVRTVDAKINPKDSFPKALDFKPDLVFCSRTVQLSEPMKAIRTRLKTKIAMWNVDTRTRVIEWKKLFPLIKSCDFHFVVNNYHVRTWNSMFSAETFWLPQGLQDEVYKKPENISEKDIEKYSCDVTFAGYAERGAKWRQRFIKATEETGAKVKIWGGDGNNKVYNEEHNKMVQLSKVCLGLSRPYRGNVDKYISVRNFKILGAGGFLLDLWRSGFYDVFPPGTCDSFKKTEQLKKKIGYWLGHNDKRRLAEEQGYKWVHENATYTHRMKKALELMGL